MTPAESWTLTILIWFKQFDFLNLTLYLNIEFKFKHWWLFWCGGGNDLNIETKKSFTLRLKRWCCIFTVLNTTGFPFETIGVFKLSEKCRCRKVGKIIDNTEIREFSWKLKWQLCFELSFTFRSLSSICHLILWLQSLAAYNNPFSNRIQYQFFRIDDSNKSIGDLTTYDTSWSRGLQLSKNYNLSYFLITLNLIPSH